MRSERTGLPQVRGGLLARRGSLDGDTLALLHPTLPAEQVSAHRHDQAHAVLVLRGRYEHSASQSGEVWQGGPLLLLNPPRTEHADRFAPGERLEGARFLCLQFSAATWWRWQEQVDLPARPQAQAGAATARRWLRLLHRADGGLDRLAIDELWAAAWPRAPRERSSDWLARGRQLLRERCLDDPLHPPSLTELAARLRVHPVSLARGFRRRWGLSPSDYAQGLRLDRAMALLGERPALSVAEVAAACGFHDQAHFTRQFRAAFSLAPQRWRRRVGSVQDDAPPPT